MSPYQFLSSLPPSRIKKALSIATLSNDYECLFSSPHYLQPINVVLGVVVCFDPLSPFYSSCGHCQTTPRKPLPSCPCGPCCWDTCRKCCKFLRGKLRGHWSEHTTKFGGTFSISPEQDHLIHWNTKHHFVRYGFWGRIFGKRCRAITVFIKLIDEYNYCCYSKNWIE